jgi:predicted aminopeptidase
MRERALRPTSSRGSIALLCLALAAAGCGVDFTYVMPAITGQLDILQQMRSVSDVLASGTLSDDQVSKLRLLQDVRQFAGERIGLNVGDNYATFFDSHGAPVAFNLSASRRDEFAPMTWTFPFVGTIPYLGYFSRDAALAKRDVLQSESLDVFVYQVDAYSGLGFYPNPILSPMLDRHEANLVDTVIHELLHATIWRPNDTSFNESLATFFGRTGALEYYRTRYPDDPARVADAEARFEDSDRYSAFALEVFNELDAFYKSDLSSAAKVAGRGAILAAAQQRFLDEVLPLMNLPENYDWVSEGFPANNAWLLGIRRYNLDLAVFSDVFEAVKGDWAHARLVFSAAAGAADSYGFLRDWLGRSEAERTRSVTDNAPVAPVAGHGLCAACAPYTIAPQASAAQELTGNSNAHISP